mmetsp:Transcript_18384/g.71018  ORF Transcript_18384/g.71018 Transcript_18384/m.71018 type:complete len:365 (+) Transcript_18384:81-1175(+)
MFSFCEGYYAEGAKNEDERWESQERLELGPEQVWYRQKFYGQAHYNLISRDSQIGPCVLSIKKIPDDHTYEVILRVQKGVETFTLATKYVKTSPLRRLFGLSPTLKDVVAHVCPDHAKTKFTVLSQSRMLEERLCDLECPDVQLGKFRIGLVYSRADQTHETDMFCNNESSPAYEEFLDFIGQRISLASWTGYDGGLDLTNGTSGTHSVFTKHNDNEIMWHVATLMPYFEADNQQLERKKFIGNDRVVLLFREEGGEPLSPYVVASKAIHVFAIVSPHTDPDQPDKKLYSFSVAIKSSMPLAPPEIPDPPIFEKGEEFRTFLLDKLVNCYAATNYASELKQLMSCKYMHGLNQVVQEFSVKPKN